jgi:prevent-host-death family protein
MRRVSVAEAKAHFSELIADARRGRRTVILRHGKPAAAVVPAMAVEPTPKPLAMTREQALAVFESFSRLGDPSVDAIGELRAGRR